MGEREAIIPQEVMDASFAKKRFLKTIHPDDAGAS